MAMDSSLTTCFSAVLHSTPCAQVINLDFPSKPELFVHRVGRAARAGRHGTAFSILTREELAYLIDLHLFLSRCAPRAMDYLG